MSRLRIPIAGLLVAMAILAVIFSIFSRSSEALRNLWNLAVWTIPPTGILYAYGSERCRAGIRSFLVSLARALLVLAGVALSVGGLGLLIVAAVVVVLGVSTKIILFDNTVTFVLCSAVLVMVFFTHWGLWGSGNRRTFGAGAAAFGWPFLFLGLAPALSKQVPLLWSTDFLHSLYPYLYVTVFPEPAPLEPTLGASLPDFRTGLLVFKSVSTNYLQFQIIGHCLISLLIATAGGLLARGLAARRQDSAAGANEASPEHLPTTEAISVDAILGPLGGALPGRQS